MRLASICRYPVKGFTPEINAVSTLIIIVSMGLMLLVARQFRFGGERP